MVMQTQELANRVTGALLKDPRTEEAVIDVINERGKVTLTGRVESEEIRQAAENIARQQDGVVTVINELKVG